MRKLIFIITIIISTSLPAQDQQVLSLSEYLGYVKKYHPVVKQAHLMISESQAKLMKARGAFDPKIEVDHDQKKFGGTQYYNQMYAGFKIPTWYGIDVKASYERNSGTYLNPADKTPKDGLYSVGLSMDVFKNFLMNERLATLRKAQLYEKQSLADHQLAVNEILTQATTAYLDWWRAYQEQQVYIRYLNNTKIRLTQIKKMVELGDRPAIDTLEANIQNNQRILLLQKADLNYLKTSMVLSNYLWMNNTPVELAETMTPEKETPTTIKLELALPDKFTDAFNLSDHPKMRSLQYKIQALEVEKKLRKIQLFPDMQVQYNFLQNRNWQFAGIGRDQFKWGVQVAWPIFMRKQRAEVRLTDYELQQTQYQQQQTQLFLQNKLKAIDAEIDSYQNQSTIARTMISDYYSLLKGEERKFEIGESSLFMINSRESKLIESELKVIEIENEQMRSQLQRMSTLGIIP